MPKNTRIAINERQEIDWVEEREGMLFGYEFKWGNRKAKLPKAWAAAYPEAEFHVINKENFSEFVI